MQVWPVPGPGGYRDRRSVRPPRHPAIIPGQHYSWLLPTTNHRTGHHHTTPHLNRRLLTNNIIEDIYRNKAIENDLENILSVHFT